MSIKCSVSKVHCFFQEPEGTPKTFIPVPSDYESDAEEAFPELEIPVSINTYPQIP